MSATPLLPRMLVFAGARFKRFLRDNICFDTETSYAFSAAICVQLNC